MFLKDFTVLQLGGEGGVELVVFLLLIIGLFGWSRRETIKENYIDEIFGPGALIGTTHVTPEDLQDYDDTDFEQLVARVWEAKGYETELTGSGPDRGADVLATNPSETLLIEAKRYGPDTSVSAPTVQKAVGAKEQHKADRAVVVTTSDFTEPAREAAAHTNVELLNGWELAGAVNSALNE